MLLLLSILGTILLGLGVLLAAIILIPYTYQFSGENLADPHLKGSISWLFGGLKITFSQYSQQNREMTLLIMGISKKVSIRQRSTSEHDKKDLDFHTYLKPDIILETISLVFKILKHCQPKVLTIYARIGFNDPMYTGFLCALNSQYSWLFNKYDINIQPVFDEEVIEGRFSIGGRIWLTYLILVMIRFFITKPIRNIVLSNLKRKNKGGPQYVG